MEKTTNITTTWTGMLPSILAVLQASPNQSDKKFAYDQLRNMAKAADEYNVLLEAARQVCDDGDDTGCDSCWVVSDNTFSKLVELTGM